MRELEQRGDMEGAKQELAKLSLQVLTLGLPHVVPKLQAVMAQTTLEAGDSLKALLREIDGRTTGIASGTDWEPPLAIEQSLHLSN
jgi:hypothetical protein